MKPGNSGAAAALGVVDTGAAFSAMNDAAARGLGALELRLATSAFGSSLGKYALH